MDKPPFTIEDIDEKIRPKVYTQIYSPDQLIDGIKIIQLKSAGGEEGDFCELMRLNSEGEFEQLPGFKVAQINRSTQFPGSVKAWHLHYRQDELWYVPEESHLVAGLWDIRKRSKTFNQTNRIVLGGSTHKMLYIPRGVAHGSANFFNQLGIIIYFMNDRFDKERPDEQRIPWDALGADFWSPERD